MDKKSKMFSLVGQWRESGLSRKVFAKQHGIRSTSFDYWCKKQSNEVLKNEDQPTFIGKTNVLDHLWPDHIDQHKPELSVCC